ncbi:MAG: ferrous iron transport protein B [Pirellulales bacterium]|nr:ferrous iron transport protein B [Pirellulales bacterium]
MTASSVAKTSQFGTRTLQFALVGNPNTGKSTLFNALVGGKAHTGNFPGVTVEKKTGQLQHAGQTVQLIDLPGTYSLSPRSLDELLTVDVLLGRQPEIGQIDGIICIANAVNLERQLYLFSQLAECGLPLVLVLNMWDTAQARELKIDLEALRSKLGVPVIATEAHRGRGVEGVKDAILQAAAAGVAPAYGVEFPGDFQQACRDVSAFVTENLRADAAYPEFLCARLILDVDGAAEARLAPQVPDLKQRLQDVRAALRQVGHELPALESQQRYAWCRQLASAVVQSPTVRKRSWTDRLDAVLTHRLWGLLICTGLMFLVFQALFSWAEPLMGYCETGQEWVSGVVTASMSPGSLRSLLTDGVIAGVGGVLIFLPQIMLLFLFIAILEDSGYMARAAYMVDRLLSVFGLNGKSFLPLMSSFACAVPGIMATRVIEDRKDRMVTILIAPLMSCSARLPVYLLLIAAFVPQQHVLGGFLSVQGMVLFGMSALGAVVAIPVAWLFRKTLFRGAPSSFVMELPDYKIPSLKLVLLRSYRCGKTFVLRAGTLIFATTIVVWAAAYFPGDHTLIHELDAQIEALADETSAAEEVSKLQSERNEISGKLISESVLGQAGRAVEPVVKPLGWDWKIGMGVLASFPAREVVIATLGTIYSLGGDQHEESESLQDAMRDSKWPDGTPVYNLPVALSLMVFFALCAQCASTLVIMKRETNSWRWPALCFIYMTGLAYVGSLLTYQVSRWIMT